MAVRKGLGRGLDLLIPKDEGMPKKSIEKNKENKDPKENQVLTLSIHDVEISQESSLMKMRLKS